jgi:hypothetical protein
MMCVVGGAILRRNAFRRKRRYGAESRAQRCARVPVTPPAEEADDFRIEMHILFTDHRLVLNVRIVQGAGAPGRKHVAMRQEYLIHIQALRIKHERIMWEFPLERNGFPK